MRMRIQRPVKQHVVTPVICGNSYKCVCGNRLTGYRSQYKCEICESVLDWTNVIAGIDEIKKRK